MIDYWWVAVWTTGIMPSVVDSFGLCEASTAE